MQRERAAQQTHAIAMKALASLHGACAALTRPVAATDDGCCGCNWHTWGNPAYAPSVPLSSSSPADFDGAAAADGGAESAPPQPPYVVDGWTRHEVDEPSALQLCRFDSEDFVGNSRTVAFRRK